MSNPVWEASAEYADGTSVSRTFPYFEDGNAREENERQYDLECWLLSHHPDCTWYSVCVVADAE